MEEPKRKKSTWLKELQDKSWEPEILISGIVIYGLFKIFPFVDEFHLYLENYASDFFKGSVDDNIIALLKVSIFWLILGFITHLFLRSFWVAYIGLSYVYKTDIDYKKLKYNNLFLKDKTLNRPITSNIEKLERVCSTIFSISILFFMNVLGLIFLISVIGFFVYLWLEIFPEKNDFTVFDYILKVLLIISVFDYLSSGLLKRIPYFNRFYYPIYKVISFFTLAPLYRKIYYTFITNHKKWKVFLFLTLFIVVTFFSSMIIRRGFFNSLVFSPNAYAENVMSPRYFLEEAEGELSNKLWMPSKKVNSQILEVFVVHSPAFEQTHIIPLCDYDEKIKKDSINIDRLKLDCLDKFYELRLNDTQVNSEFFYTKNNKTNQDGLEYFIPIDSLSRGRHSISLYYNYYNKKEDTIFKRLRAKTDFYKTTSKK